MRPGRELPGRVVERSLVFIGELAPSNASPMPKLRNSKRHEEVSELCELERRLCCCDRNVREEFDQVLDHFFGSRRHLLECLPGAYPAYLFFGLDG
jgi:hypothetical protein